MSDYRKPGGFGGDRGNGGGFKKKSFGAPRFGGKPDFKGGARKDFGPKEMFRATCSECQNSCEVPFRPSGDKPVYCNNCFSAARGNQGNDYAPKNGDRREGFAPRKDFTAAPHQAPSHTDAHVAELKKEMAALHAKFDKLFSLLGTKAVDATTAMVKTVEQKIEKVNTKMAVKAPKVKSTPKATVVAKKAPAKVVAKVVQAKKPVAKKKK